VAPLDGLFTPMDNAKINAGLFLLMGKCMAEANEMLQFKSSGV
jgi:hypothetical protein